MIISHKHKYLFIELPRTGTTAISNELTLHYDGTSILTKHSTYESFLKTASEDEKSYFVFSCIRNPIDRTFSLFTKLKNKDEAYYKDLSSNRSKIISNNYFISRMRYIKKHDLVFSGFLQKYYYWPYSDWSILSHKKFDYIIRFENLQEDFSNVLKKLKIEQKRLIPVINKTDKKENYKKLLKINENKKIAETFLPFMKFWNYQTPCEWEKYDTVINKGKYNFINLIRKFYWKNIK